MKTFLGAPILHGNERLGNLYLAEKTGGKEFTHQDVNLLVMFAAQAAMAIWHAQLYARESKLREQAESEHAKLTAIIENSAAGIVGRCRIGAVGVLLPPVGLSLPVRTTTGGTVRKVQSFTTGGARFS